MSKLLDTIRFPGRGLLDMVTSNLRKIVLVILFYGSLMAQQKTKVNLIQ